MSNWMGERVSLLEVPKLVTSCQCCGTGKSACPKVITVIAVVKKKTMQIIRLNLYKSRNPVEEIKILT